MEFVINLDEEYTNKNKSILKHFGENHQYKKFIEELEELRDEMVNFRKKYKKKYDYYAFISNNFNEAENLFSEISDCVVVALQINKIDFLGNLIDIMEDYYDIYWINKLEIEPEYEEFMIKVSKKIENIMKFKIDRTIERYKISLED